MIRTILWIGFVVLVVFFNVQHLKFKDAGVSDIEDYEYAASSDALQILESWEKAGLVKNVKVTIYYNFVFMVFYLLLMIGCSNDQVTLERNIVLNSLLRVNIGLATIVALLDLSENLILLHNITPSNSHIYSSWVTLTKFTLAYWIVALWIISNLKTRIVYKVQSSAAS